MKAIEAETCVGAWLRACSYLLRVPEWRAYTVVLEIADPLALPARDRAVHDLVDAFLRDKGGMPISTVVNTIFPAQLYRRHGAAGVYNHYPVLYRKIKKHKDARKWGTYAMRMIQRKDHEGQTIYPLKDLVAKIARQAVLSGGKRATYELGTVDPFLDIPVYDPGNDRGFLMGGPCLGHVSVKLTTEHRVLLTGMYRSHFYIQRALGNLLGLAHLQDFIAKEAGICVGPLICHSTMAQLNSLQGHWGGADIRALIEACLEAYAADDDRRAPATGGCAAAPGRA